MSAAIDSLVRELAASSQFGAACTLAAKVDPGTGQTIYPDTQKVCWCVLQALYKESKAHDISHMSFGPSSYPYVKRGETDMWVFTQGGYVDGEWSPKDVAKGYGKSSEEALLQAAVSWLEKQLPKAEPMSDSRHPSHECSDDTCWCHARPLGPFIDPQVGVACKACNAFMSVKSIDRDGKVWRLTSLGNKQLTAKCLACGAQDGFVPVTHAMYHSEYLEDDEKCDFCKEDVPFDQRQQPSDDMPDDRERHYNERAEQMP